MKRIIIILSVLLVAGLWISPGYGQITWSEHLVAPVLTQNRWSEIADINGDSINDVIACGVTQVFWYKNNGYEIFSPHLLSSTFNGGFCVRPVDLDDDGDTDILGAANTGNLIAWWQNMGNETFTYNVIASFAGVNVLDPIDVDGDNDLDIVGSCGCAAAKKISWFENDGNQNFIERNIITGYYGWWAEGCDVDDDGDIDIVAVDYYSGSPSTSHCSWFENDGNQVFTRHDFASQAGAQFYCARAGDLDNDLDIDFVISAYGADFIRWYENDGNQNFTPHDLVLALDGPEHLQIVDLDDDGDNDVIAAAWMDYHVYWFENDSIGNFTQHEVAYSYCPGHAYSGDMNSDGDLDIVGTNYFGNTLPWWENLTSGATTLTMSVTPDTTPVTIPPGGGSFQFTFELENTGTTPYTLDLWTDITTPSQTTFPILNRPGLTLPGGVTLARVLTQFIPGSAMSGTYSYNAHVRDHDTWEVYCEDSFPFEKLGGVDNPNHDLGWTLMGWDENPALATQYGVVSAYPNPFNPATTIRFSLTQASRVTLTVSDLSGRRVADLVNGWREAGSQEVTFDGSNLASGIYLYSLKADGLSASGKLVLMK